MNFSIFNSFRFNLIRVCPRVFHRGCLRKDLKDDFFLRGYHKFRQEIQITNLIKELRVIKAAVQSRMSEKEWRKYKKDASIRCLWMSEKKRRSSTKVVQEKTTNIKARIDNDINVEDRRQGVLQDEEASKIRKEQS